MKFPKPWLLKIDDKGRMTFTPAQWKFLLKIVKSKAKTIKAQKRVIKKFIEEALRRGMEKIEANSDR